MTETIPPGKTPESPSRNHKILHIAFNIFMSIIVLMLLAILAWVSKPHITKLIPEKPTATPTITPTFTPIPTRAPTTTPTITLTPTVTATPEPVSIYKVEDFFDVYPDVPEIAVNAYILDEDDSAQVNPAFESPLWYSSEAIGQQLGIEFSEPFYATYAAGWISWQMDMPLKAAIYEVFVLDTNTSSGGFLDFTVSLNDVPLQPLLGQTRARYKSSVSKPPQSGDQWISIGTYRFDPSGVVTISTSWDDRDEFSIVAVDRIMIIQLPESSNVMTGPFPQDRMTFISDDTQAVLNLQDPIFTNNDHLSWGDRYQFVVNPDNDVTAIWALSDSVPVGQYEIFVWVPELQGTAQAEYKLLVNDTPFLSDIGAETVSIQHGGREGGQWVSLGTWTISDLYGNVVNLAVQMKVTGGTSGEIAFDAIAFMKSP
ncbi:MAG: hypothetical protein RBT34_02270 [Anaerolineaceae bacterium]|nr:hypothetical protein [Anaerolineaceae bacterium]